MAANDPITKKDLFDLGAGIEARIGAKIDALGTRLDALETRVDGLETHLIEVIEEKVRDAQTEILRGFIAFQNSNAPRMRKMEADLSNIDASTSQRLEILEARMFEVEKKLLTGNR